LRRVVARYGEWEGGGGELPSRPACAGGRAAGGGVCGGRALFQQGGGMGHAQAACVTCLRLVQVVYQQGGYESDDIIHDRTLSGQAKGLSALASRAYRRGGEAGPGGEEGRGESGRGGVGRGEERWGGERRGEDRLHYQTISLITYLIINTYLIFSLLLGD